MIFQVLLQISFDGLPNLIYPIESYRVAFAPQNTRRLRKMWHSGCFTFHILHVLQQWGKMYTGYRMWKITMHISSETPFTSSHPYSKYETHSHYEDTETVKTYRDEIS